MKTSSHFRQFKFKLSDHRHLVFYKIFSFFVRYTAIISKILSSMIKFLIFEARDFNQVRQYFERKK